MSMVAVPHAYVVEILVNPGSFGAYWRPDPSGSVFGSLDEARADRLDLIEGEGFPAEHVRVAALTVVPS